MDTFDKLKAEKDRLVEQEWQTAATAAGWKSPEDVTSIIQAAIDAFYWNTALVARQEALREVGAWLEQQQAIVEILKPLIRYWKVYLDDIQALKSGRMPEGKLSNCVK